MSFDDFLQKQADTDKGYLLYEFTNERGDTLTIFEDHIEIEIKRFGWTESWPMPQFGQHGNGYKAHISFDNISISHLKPSFSFFGNSHGHIQFGKNEKYNHNHIIYFKSDDAFRNKRKWSEVESLVMRAKVNYEKLSKQQTVVKGNYIKGDYVDDRDTVIKDSILNRSTIGSGGNDKFARLEKLTEMKKEGLIDDNEFKQMKKEILSK